MNSIDIDNIKKELVKRKAANYEWKDGGDLSKDDIMLRTTKELKELKNNYEKSKKKTVSEKIYKLVDDIFKKYAEDDDNMIPLSCAYRPDYRIYGNACTEVYDSITFSDVAGYNDNPYIKPIARNWSGDDDRWEKYSDDLIELFNKTVEAKVPLAEEFWEDNGESLNEYWYGVIAITRDYKIVGFEIRDDGCPQDSIKLNYPCIMSIL